MNKTITIDYQEFLDMEKKIKEKEDSAPIKEENVFYDFFNVAVREPGVSNGLTKLIHLYNGNKESKYTIGLTPRDMNGSYNLIIQRR